MPKNTVSYKVGTQEVQLRLKTSYKGVAVEATLNKTGVKYVGYCQPINDSPARVVEAILKKLPNVKINLKPNHILLSVASTIIYMTLHIETRGKENESYQPIIASPSTSYSSELKEMQKEVRQCKLGYLSLKEDLKEIKETMHRTLEQQSTNYTDRSINTRCNNDDLGSHKDHMITQYIEKLKLNEILCERNKEIEYLALQLRSMSNEQKQNKAKLDREFNTIKVGFKSTLAQILQQLSKSAINEKQSTCLTTREEATAAKVSKYNGFIKKPRIIPLIRKI